MELPVLKAHRALQAHKVILALQARQVPREQRVPQALTARRALQGLKVKPEAVIVEDDGFMKVNYAALGIPFMRAPKGEYHV